MAKPIITAERLREVVVYDPATGVFTWVITRSSRARAGDIAGAMTQHGYLTVCIDYGRYYLHRLAWLWAYGAWPSKNIDHIDGDRTNNSLSNLRDVSQMINAQNTKHARNASGLMGVYMASANCWVASLCVNRKKVHIGCFRTPELAHKAYLEAKRRLHEGCTL